MSVDDVVQKKSSFCNKVVCFSNQDPTILNDPTNTVVADAPQQLSVRAAAAVLGAAVPAGRLHRSCRRHASHRR